MRKPFVRIVLLAALCACGIVTIVAADPDWARLTPPQLPSGSISIYDGSHNRLYLFPSFSSPLGEYWARTMVPGAPWERIANPNSGPNPFAFRGGCADPIGQRVIVVYAGAPPGGISGPGSLVLFAYSVPAGGTTRDGRDEVEGESPRPEDRRGFCLVRDSRRNRLILFGGGPSSHEATFSDVWTLPLSGPPVSWQKLNVPEEPEPRSGAAAAYDSLGDRMLVFGGAKIQRDGTIVDDSNDLLALNLSGTPQWSPLEASGIPPGETHSAQATMDPQANRFLVTGGAYSHGTIWSLDLTGSPRWEPFPEAAPTGPEAPTLLFAVMPDGNWLSVNRPLESWVIRRDDPATWTLADAPFRAGPPLEPRLLLADPTTGTSLATDFIGPTGIDQHTLNMDLWRLSTGLPPRWDKITDAGSPPPNLGYYATAYDSRRLRWVLMGESNDRPPRPEIWTLQVGPHPRWAPLSVQGVPPPRFAGAAIAYDALRDRIAVLGGAMYEGSSSVVMLELVGAPRWVRPDSSGAAPMARAHAALMWDPERDRFLAFGGVSSRFPGTAERVTQYFRDTWSLQVRDALAWDSLSTSGVYPAFQARAFAFYEPWQSAMGLVSGQPRSSQETLHINELDRSTTWWNVGPNTSYPPLQQGVSSYYLFLPSATSYDPASDRLLVVRNGSAVWEFDRDHPTHIALMDLEPSDPTNTLRADAQGNVTAVILSNAAFDAATVDPATVTLADAPARRQSGADRATLRDVDHDGQLDRVLKFARADLQLDSTTDVVTLKGETRSGEAVVGYDLYQLAVGGKGNSTGRGVDGTSIATSGDPDSPSDIIPEAPATLELAFQGPVRGAATVRLALPRAAMVVIEVFAVDGRRVARVDLGALGAGLHTASMAETAGLSPGIYFARLRVGEDSARAKLLVLR